MSEYNVSAVADEEIELLSASAAELGGCWPPGFRLARGGR